MVDLNNDDIENANLVSTDALGVGGQSDINYWPPEFLEPVVELNTSTPATSYASLTLSEPPSDAKYALIQLDPQGDGTADRGRVELREAGTTVSNNAYYNIWAGHGAFIGSPNITVPMDSSNAIEYKVTNISDLIIRTAGYY